MGVKRKNTVSQEYWGETSKNAKNRGKRQN